MIKKVLVFQLADTLYGLEAVSIQEIVESPALHYIPKAPPHFRGAINFHGNIVPVLDLPGILDLPRVPLSHWHIVLALSDGALALSVSAIHGMIMPDEDTTISSGDDLQGVPLARALLCHEDQMIWLFDIQQLMKRLETLL